MNFPLFLSGLAGAAVGGLAYLVAQNSGSAGFPLAGPMTYVFIIFAVACLLLAVYAALRAEPAPKA